MVHGSAIIVPSNIVVVIIKGKQTNTPSPPNAHLSPSFPLPSHQHAIACEHQFTTSNTRPEDPMNTNISGAMSYYLSGPSVPMVYAKSPPANRARNNVDRDQALLSQIGRISAQRSPDSTPAESIRSGRAGSVASSNYTTATGGSGGTYGVMSPTSSFSAGASSSMVQHPGILAANTTFE